MRLSIFALCCFCLYISATQACSPNGDIKDKCEIGHCEVRDRCRLCECDRRAWDCSYGGSSDCSLEGEFYELGTIGDSKYIYSMYTVGKFSTAKKACEDQGGHLGIFETTEELDALKELIKAAPKWARSAEFAIGAKTEDLGETWTWIDGTGVPSSFIQHFWGFMSRKPKDNTTSPHCLIIQPRWDFGVHFGRCEHLYVYTNFVCEVPKSVNIPLYLDAEAPEELGSFGNSTYSLLTIEKSWHAMRRDCQKHGGDLAVAKSEAVWKFIFKAVQDRGVKNEIFLGATAPSGSDLPWKWVDGQSLEKTDGRWEDQCPSSVGSACLFFDVARGETTNWIDHRCSYNAKAICEKPLHSG